MPTVRLEEQWSQRSIVLSAAGGPHSCRAARLRLDSPSDALKKT